MCGSALRNKVYNPPQRHHRLPPGSIDVPPITGTNPKNNQTVKRSADDDEPFTALAFKIVADPYVADSLISASTVAR